MNAALRAGAERAHPLPSYVHYRDRYTGRIESVRPGASLVSFYESKPEQYEPVQAAAMDAVIIEGPLPEVEDDSDGDLTIGRHTFAAFDDIADAREYLLALAAVVAHLEDHPPVDEAQVQALTEVLKADFAARDVGVYYPPEIRARRLVQRGVTVKGATS